MIDTFTGWIEGFPTQTEKAEEVVEKLLHEIIPRFGLPRSLQSDNGTSFTSKVTQGVSKALGITYYLHCAWRPQSSGKVERDNQVLKSTIKKKKDNPGDLPGMEGGLPIALLHTDIERNRLVLVLRRCYMGDLFVYVSDLFLDPEAQTLWSLPWPLGNSHKIYTCKV